MKRKRKKKMKGKARKKKMKGKARKKKGMEGGKLKPGFLVLFLFNTPLRSPCQSGLLDVSLHWDLVKTQQNTCQNWFLREREVEEEGEGELSHDKKKKSFPR